MTKSCPGQEEIKCLISCLIQDIKHRNNNLFCILDQDRYSLFSNESMAWEVLDDL